MRLRWQMTRSVLGRLAIGGAAILCILLLLLGALPVHHARRLIADRLSVQFGRPVAVGGVERLERFSFTPTILLRDVRVPQAAWAGPGTLAFVREVRLRLPVLPLLIGHVSPRAITLVGGRITLVRAADGRESWSKGGAKKESSGPGLRLEQIAVRDTLITYRDAKRDRSLTLRLDARPGSALIGTGSGLVRGAAVRATLRAGPAMAGKRWPFRALLDGPALRFDARGDMAHVFDTSDMQVHVETRASDLRLVDAIVEAGLFGTQPVRLSADARHVDDRWDVQRIGGTIGRSRFTGKLKVWEDGARKQLDAEVFADALDFDDLSSDEGRARGAAKQRRIGPRVVPDSRIDLTHMQDLDGELRFTIKRLLWKGPSPFRAASGILRLDHGRLTLSPVSVALSRGTMTGRAIVDQRHGARVPTLTLNLDVDGSTLKTFVPTAPMNGRFQARARLRGPGVTVREAIAHSNGHVGLVARDGPMPAKLASFLGLDVGRGALTDEAKGARLRCLIMRLDVRNGLGRGNPILIDTSRSQSWVTGTLRFGPETVAMTITGAPKHKSLLRLETPVRVSGTVKAPEIAIPPRVKTVGNVLRMVGQAITGKQAPLATDADCSALARRALAG
jgi:uncharacterized protein involved in outer membrane biogenesis